MNTLGKNIRKLRKANGLTQLDIAKKIGVSDVAVGYWERGENEPSASYLYTLATILKVEMEIFFTEDTAIKEERNRYQSNVLSQAALNAAIAYDASSEEIKLAINRILSLGT